MSMRRTKITDTVETTDRELTASGKKLEEIKGTLSMGRTEITNTVETTDYNLTALGKKLEEINIADNIHGEDGDRSSKTDTIAQVKRERAALSVAKKLLMMLLSKAQEDEAARAAAAKATSSTKVTFGTQTSGFQIGVSDASNWHPLPLQPPPCEVHQRSGPRPLGLPDSYSRAPGVLPFIYQPLLIS